MNNMYALLLIINQIRDLIRWLKRQNGKRYKFGKRKAK